MKHETPQEIIEIAELLTDLEYAFHGVDRNVSSAPGTYIFHVNKQQGRTGFFIGTPDAGQFLSLDWIAEENQKGTLPLMAEISLRNYYSFHVSEETAADIKAALEPKIAALKLENEATRKAELKEKIKKDFEAAWTFTPEKAVEYGLLADLEERGPDDLVKEAVRAHLWLHPEERQDFLETADLFTKVWQTLNDADTEKLFDQEERNTLIREAGEQFIVTRKLERTLKQLGENIHVVPMTFDL